VDEKNTQINENPSNKILRFDLDLVSKKELLISYIFLHKKNLIGKLIFKQFTSK